MWPIPALDHELVSISFSPHVLVCNWIQKTKTGTAPLAVRAHKRYVLDNLELTNLILFNPTSIKKHIVSFLSEHGLQNAFVTFCLHGPSVTEQCIMLPTSTPHRADFGIAQSSTVLWEYRYLYPHDDGHVFYVYTVARSLILQYQLLAIAAHCNLITITTQTMGLLDAYKNIFGAAFRHSQLAVDMIRSDNKLEKLISVDALRRMLSIPAGLEMHDEKISVAAACGLFCAERIER